MRSTTLLFATRLLERLRVRDDRGDVPGWVLVTLMTAGLVSALWVVAAPMLTDLLGNALGTVAGP